ncbi:MAG: alpha/beta fold hydrolase [Pseudomonadota bacterium]
MKLPRPTTIALGALLLVLVGFGVSAYGVGSWLVAPNRTGMQAPPAELALAPVSFESASGSRLAGWRLESDRDCGTVVLMHGVRADKRSMVPRARFLLQAGYDVLLFDFQAHGESPGEHITFGHLEQRDAAAALAFAAKQWPNQPVAVIGQSLGGAAAALNGPILGADAVVLESVYPTLETATRNRVRFHTGGLGVLDDVMATALLLQLEPRLGFIAEDLRPVDRIGEIDAPVLIMAGGEDRHTTPEDSRRLFERAGHPKRFWLVEGAGHVDFHRHDPEGYERTVLGFLDEHLPCEEAQ